MGTIVWKETKYSGNLLATLYHLQQENVMCDLQIKSRNLVIPVHTLILQAFSNTVDTHHSSELVNVDDFVAKCSNFDSHIVSVFIQYLYTGEVIVEKHDLETFLKLCKDLNLENVVFGIQEECNRIEECLKRRSVPVTNTLSQKNVICSKPHNESSDDSVMNSFQVEVKREPNETLDFGNSEMNNSASDQSIQPHETEKQNSENHMKFETDSVNLRMCPICNKLFEKEDEYAFHMESDHKLYSCSKCEFQDGERSNLNEHIRTKHSNLSKNGSDTKADNKAHQPFHKPLASDYQYMLIVKTENIQMEANVTSLDKVFLCSVCGLTFNNRTSGSQHENRHLKIGPYKCQQCDMVFFSKINFRRHNLRHSLSIKYFKCSKCHKKFKMKSDLERHQRRESKDLKFKCDECGQAYESSVYLQDHILNQHKNNDEDTTPYKCDVCSKTFKHRNNLYRHKKIHDNTAFTCSECNKTFKTKRYLFDHMKCHQTSDCMKCALCFKIFKNRKCLVQHIKTKHK